MLFVIHYLNFQSNVVIFVMAYARLAVVFYMLPVLGERVLSGLVIKNTLISSLLLASGHVSRKLFLLSRVGLFY